MGEYKTSDPAKYDAVLSNAYFKTYTVRCRAKTDNYKEQVRVRVTAMGIAPINYKEECMRLVSPSGPLVFSRVSTSFLACAHTAAVVFPFVRLTASRSTTRLGAVTLAHLPRAVIFSELQCLSAAPLKPQTFLILPFFSLFSGASQTYTYAKDTPSVLLFVNVTLKQARSKVLAQPTR